MKKAEALELAKNNPDMKTYISDTPCKNGHLERLLSGHCSVCIKVTQAKGDAARYKRNGDAMRAKSRAWKAANVDKVAAKQKEWRKANPDYQKEWEASNIDRVRFLDRQWRCNNPNKVKAKALKWYYANREVANSRSRTYKAANREILKTKRILRHLQNHADNLAQRRAAYKANPERYKLYSRKWRAENPEAVREKSRIRRGLYPEKAKASTAKWRAANLERLKAQRALYLKANPEKAATHARNRRARIRNAEGIHTAAEIQFLLIKQRFRCAYYAACRTSIRDHYHADHIVSLTKGGHNGISNIQLLCQPCNSRKYVKDAIDFAQSLGFLL